MASCFRFWFLVILRSPLLTRSRPAAECSPLWYVSMQYFSRDSNRLNGTHSSSLRLPANTQALLYSPACCRPGTDKCNVINEWPNRLQRCRGNSCCKYCGIKLHISAHFGNTNLHDKEDFAGHSYK